jgi:hypothetical protein
MRASDFTPDIERAKPKRLSPNTLRPAFRRVHSAKEDEALRNNVMARMERQSDGTR